MERKGIVEMAGWNKSEGYNYQSYEYLDVDIDDDIVIADNGTFFQTENVTDILVIDKHSMVITTNWDTYKVDPFDKVDLLVK